MSLSHKENRNNFSLILNSDQEEVLLPVLDGNKRKNPGATRLIPATAFNDSQTVRLISSQKELLLLLQVVGPAVTSTTLLDLLNYIDSKTVIIKMDVEGYECKVLHHYLTHEHPSYYLPYILMEWKHIAINMGSSCPDVQGFVETLFSNGYSPISLHGNREEDQQVPEKLEILTRNDLFSRRLFNVLWAHEKAPALFWQ